jgi:integrase
MPRKGFTRVSPGVWLAPDGRYWIRAVRKRAGRRVEVERFAKAGTEAAAKQERAALLREAAAKLTAAQAPPTPRRDTLADYVERWVVAKAERVRPGTIDHYIDVLGRALLPVLGSMPIESITRADVDRWVAWAEAQESRSGRPYSTATLNSWWRVVAQVLRDASGDLMTPDPTRRVSPPKSSVRGVRQSETLTPAQLAQLLATVKSTWPIWYAEVYTLAFSGMRPSELYALRWDDIDEAQGVITISRSVVRGNVSATKTDAPREAGLHAQMAAVLKAHRARLMAAKHPGVAGGLVFPARSGRHRGTSALGKMLRLASRTAGLRVTVGPLMLRRTFNTLSVLGSVDRIVLRAQLGHTDEAMTERYAGVPASAKIAAVGTLISTVLGEMGGNSGGT